jgi:hypothetical protein
VCDADSFADVLGSGSFGHVLRGVDKLKSETVALKVRACERNGGGAHHAMHAWAFALWPCLTSHGPTHAQFQSLVLARVEERVLTVLSDNDFIVDLRRDALWRTERAGGWVGGCSWERS